MNVTFETAKRLKDAGFPQPETCFGQVWYLNHNERPVLIGSAEGTITQGQERVFAPSATDILKVFSNDGYDSPLLYWRPINGMWVCDFDVQTFDRENPAEACGAYWLSIHEKTTTTNEKQDQI